MSFNVVATYTAEEGKEEEMAGYLRSMMEASRAEPGCLEYRVVRSNDDPAVFVIIEQYKNAEAFDAHKNSPHFEEYATQGAWTMLAKREVVIGRGL